MTDEFIELSTVEIPFRGPQKALVLALHQVRELYFQPDGAINASACLDEDALRACLALGIAARAVLDRGPRVKTVVD